MEDKILYADKSVQMRPITREDTASILKWRNSEEVNRYFNYQDTITEQEHLEWIKTKVETGQVYQYIVSIVEGDKRIDIGSAYLNKIDKKNKKAEYGIFLGEKSAIGNGYGTIIAKRIVQFAFEELGLHRVYLQVHEDNERAIRCYENAGFEREALLRDDIYVGDRYINLVMMGIVRVQSVSS